MKILLIPDSFKGSLSSARLCAIMKKAALDVMPDAQVTSIPAADGGEGTLDVIRHIALNPFFFESGVRIEALCDVTNPLCGPNGSARVFGPQKGATPEMVETMEAGMAHLATIFERNKGPKLADMPCAGAAGGCGAGVVAFLNGRLLSGSDALLDLMNFSALAADADLIVTGEGMVDDQTAGGKLVSAVAARANGTPVVVLAGGIAEGTNLEALYEKGVTAVMPVTSRPMTLGEAMSSGAEGVRLTATQLFRLAGALKA